MGKAEWIWWNKAACSDEYAAFADEFYLDRRCKAKIKISVADDYNLYVNGELVAFGQYADYGHYKVYDEIDVSDFLKDGENEVRIVVWYHGRSFSTNRDSGVGLWYEIVDVNGSLLSYSRSGMRSMLAPGYVSHRNKIITVQLGFSYTYDTRSVAEVWGAAVAVDGFGYSFIPRPNKKLVLKPITKAVLVDKDKRLYDLGQESCGFLKIGFKASAGETVKVTYGEHIVDGKVRDKIGARDFSVELIGNGEYAEFLGAFRRLGCRYLQVYGDAEIDYIGICETEYPVNTVPFEISDPLRRRIYDTAVRTLLLCMHEHYEDCPWREQSMYIMDSRNQMLCGYYAFDNRECAESAIRLMAEGQKENGLFELCFPAEVSITIPSFSLTFATVVLEYTKKYGDVAFAEKMLPHIDRALRYFLERLDAGVFKTVPSKEIWHFYEWADTLDGALFGHNDYVLNEDYDVVINSFLSIALGATATLCRMLGRKAESGYYDEIRKQLNRQIRNKFFVAETGLFKTRANETAYSELANALCILADVATPNEARAICGYITDESAEWVKSTLSMAIFRYDALIKTDREKYKEFVLRDIDEKYGYMLEQGATSFWETIKGESDFSNAGSLCHGWSALPVYYYHTLLDNEQE